MSPYKDPEKRKEYRKQHYQKNKEKNRKYIKEWREKNPDYQKEWDANNLKRRREWKAEWKLKNPLKAKEYQKTSYERRKSSIEVKARVKAGMYPIPDGQPCQICQFLPATERHHPNYDRPLEVVYLCKIHHTYVHSNSPMLSSEAL